MTTFRNDPRIKIIKVCPKQETLSINKVIVCSPLPEDGKGQLTDWLAGWQAKQELFLSGTKNHNVRWALWPTSMSRSDTEWFGDEVIAYLYVCPSVCLSDCPSIRHLLYTILFVFVYVLFNGLDYCAVVVFVFVVGDVVVVVVIIIYIKCSCYAVVFVVLHHPANILEMFAMGMIKNWVLPQTGIKLL